MVEFIIIGLPCVLLVWIGSIFYAVRKGMNEIIAGLISIDARLARLENSAVAGAAPSDPEIESEYE